MRRRVGIWLSFNCGWEYSGWRGATGGGGGADVQEEHVPRPRRPTAHSGELLCCGMTPPSLCLPPTLVLMEGGWQQRLGLWSLCSLSVGEDTVQMS